MGDYKVKLDSPPPNIRKKLGGPIFSFKTNYSSYKFLLFQASKNRSIVLKNKKNDNDQFSKDKELENQINFKKRLRNLRIRASARLYLALKSCFSILILLINIGSCLTSWGNPVNLERSFRKLKKFEDKYIFIDPVVRQKNTLIIDLVKCTWYILYGRRKKEADAKIAAIEKQVKIHRTINAELTYYLEKTSNSLKEVVESFQNSLDDSVNNDRIYLKKKMEKPLRNLLVELEKMEKLSDSKELDSSLKELDESLEEIKNSLEKNENSSTTNIDNNSKKDLKGLKKDSSEE